MGILERVADRIRTGDRLDHNRDHGDVESVYLQGIDVYDEASNDAESWSIQDDNGRFSHF